MGFDNKHGFSVVKSMVTDRFTSREKALQECERAAHAHITNPLTQFVTLTGDGDGYYVVDRVNEGGGNVAITFRIVEANAPLKLIDSAVEMPFDLDELHGLVEAANKPGRHVRLIPLDEEGKRGAVVVWEGDENVLDSELAELVNKS